MNAIIALLILTLSFGGCVGTVENSNKESEEQKGYPFKVLTTTEKIDAEIQFENGDVIELELYPNIAPITVSNFKYLAEKGFYEGLTFHRVIKDFMIQGGCPKGDGTGDPGYSIKGEFAANGFNNTLKHERGVISMARANDPDSAGSQFFIMHQEASHLDGQYAAFGRVTNGMEIVDKIAEVETDLYDKPTEDIVIKKIVIK